MGNSISAQGTQTLPQCGAAKHWGVTGPHKGRSVLRTQPTEPRDAVSMATAIHPGLARLDILELSRAGWLPLSCGIIFSFKMPSSAYTPVGTHTFLQLFPLPFCPGKKRCGSQQHISGRAAPFQPQIASVTGGRGVGKGQMREVWEGPAIVMVPRDQRRSLVDILVVCVQGWSHLVNRLL